ncbi:MAG: serine/threonine-protein kinase [Myxococcales bacterium]|nr:serine/threonine-protein kinase [Myxococcales bacterium]
MAAGVMCPKCGTVNPSEVRACASCGTSLAVAGDKRTSLSKAATPAVPGRSKQALSGTRRTGEVRVPRSDDAARTEQGEDPAKTAAEEGLSDTVEREPTPPPRPKATRQSMPNVAAVQDGGGRRSNAAMKAIPRPPASPPSMSSAARDSLIGQKLQEYVIKERIGVGGMGVVYRAVQTLIGKEVAIKVLRSDVVTDPRDVDRMLDEARIINSIKHRGIINIFGAGTLDDGRHYLIMELLEGESLEQLMQREGKVAAGDAVLILEEVLSALGAAHSAGVVHRDLKPANIFLVKEGNKVYVKLLDFGLARRQQQNVTRIAGTPDYISPEHARGRPAGPPADLYGFGILCFHMLTGKLPFTGNTPMEVMEKHVHHEPPVPHEVNPAIPKALSELILKLLAKDPGTRPDANQVKADLRAATKQLRNASTMMSLMSIEPVSTDASRPPVKGQKTEDERARELAVKAQVQDVKRQVKKRWPLVVGGFIGVWLLGALIYALWPSGPVEPPKPVKLRPLKSPVIAVKDPTPTKPPEDPKNGTQVVEPTPTVKNPEDPQSVVNDTDPVVTDDVGDAGSEVRVVTGVLAKFVDNNSVVDDVAIGEFRRELRDGQSIEAMLTRMNDAIKDDRNLEELYARILKRVTDLCDQADTKKKLIDCDDEVRRVNTLFYPAK